MAPELQAPGKPGLEPVAQGKRGRRMPSDFVKLVEGLALAKLPRTTAAIHQQANKVALHQGWAPVSYSTIRSIVGEIDPGMMTLAQQGAAVYRDKYELVWRRRAERPNAVWQADHTELDILVLTLVIGRFARGSPRSWMITREPCAGT